MKIGIYDFVYNMPNFLDLDILGKYGDLVESLEERYTDCVYCYDEKEFEIVLKELNISCDCIVDDGDLLGLMFKTEQDKLAFILKAS
jgi:hypothetical protein